MRPFRQGGRGAHRSLPALCVLALAALAAGCADPTVSPVADEVADVAVIADAVPVFHRSRGGPPMYRNEHRYRRRGHDGRGGRHRHSRSCRHEDALEAEALLGATRVTRILVTTGDLDDLSSAEGEIVKLQVKVYDDAGRYMGVRNYNRLAENDGTVTVDMEGLQRGWTLRIMGLVRETGRNRHRTRVLETRTVVKAAAQLTTTLNLPASANVGVPTVITATVFEVGGDNGGAADCVLYVGGVEVDRANNIWVDAGDAVTCAFTYTFTGSGREDVQVQLVSPTPVFNPDCETGGCGGTEPVVVATDDGSLDVVVPNFTTWSASADDRSVYASRTFDSFWQNAVTGRSRDYYDFASTTERRQTVNVQGTLNRPAQWPLAEVTVSYGPGGSWLQDTWSGLAFERDSAGTRCVNRQRTEQAAIFYLCSDDARSTFGYTFFAGTVTYHSTGFAKTFDGVSTEGDTYTWNDEYTVYNGGEQARPWGASVSLSIEIRDGGGTFRVDPLIPLAPYTGPTGGDPRACVETQPYWLDGGTLRECSATETREWGVGGSATG